MFESQKSSKNLKISEILRFSRFFRFSKLRFSKKFFYPKTHFLYLDPDFLYLLRHFLYPTDTVGIIKTKKYCPHPPKLETLSTPKRPNRAPNPIGPYLDRPLRFGHFSPSPGGPQPPESTLLIAVSLCL